MIRTQLVSYIYNGFLVPVLAPALHKVSDWQRPSGKLRKISTVSVDIALHFFSFEPKLSVVLNAGLNNMVYVGRVHLVS